MERKDGNIYLKILVNILIYALIFFVVVYLGPRVLSFFLPFVVAWIIAWIANPLVQFMENKINLRRKYSSVLIIIFVIGLVVFGLYALVSFIIEQSVALVDELPSIATTITTTLDQVVYNLNETLSGMPLAIQEPIIELGESIRINVIAFISNASIPEATLGFTRNIFDYILFTILVFIASYFLIKDNDRILNTVKEATPATVLEKYDLIQYHFKYAVGGYVQAQLKLMLMVIVILYIGFKFIGARYAFLLAILTGIIDLLPILGTGFVIWPWAVIELILGNYFNASLLMIIYVVCQFLKNILQPKVVGDSVGVDALTTFVLMFIGYQLKGVTGLILAVPIGLILFNLYQVGMFDNIIRGFKILFKDINAYRKF